MCSAMSALWRRASTLCTRASMRLRGASTEGVQCSDDPPGERHDRHGNQQPPPSPPLQWPGTSGGKDWLGFISKVTPLLCIVLVAIALWQWHGLLLKNRQLKEGIQDLNGTNANLLLKNRQLKEGIQALNDTNEKLRRQNRQLTTDAQQLNSSAASARTNAASERRNAAYLRNELASCQSQSRNESRQFHQTVSQCLNTMTTIGPGALAFSLHSDYAQASVELLRLNASWSECRSQVSNQERNTFLCRNELHAATVRMARYQVGVHTLLVDKHRCMKAILHSDMIYHDLDQKFDTSRKKCLAKKERLVKETDNLHYELASKERSISRLSRYSHGLAEQYRALQSQITDQHMRSLIPHLDASHQHAVDLAMIEDIAARLTVWVSDRTGRSMARHLLSSVGETRMQIVKVLKSFGYQFPKGTKAMVTSETLLISDVGSRPFSRHICPESLIMDFENDQETKPEDQTPSEDTNSDTKSKKTVVGVEVPTMETIHSIFAFHLFSWTALTLTPLIVLYVREVSQGNLRIWDIPRSISLGLIVDLAQNIMTSSILTTILPFFLLLLFKLPFLLRWLGSIAFTAGKTAVNPESCGIEFTAPEPLKELIKPESRSQKRRKDRFKRRS